MKDKLEMLPAAAEAAADDLPLLRNWRLVAGVKVVGEVTGHPWLPDGWMLTSALVEAPDPTTRTARCESRTYRLGEPWRADRELPAEARQIVFAGILRNLRPFPVAELAKVHKAATALAQEAVRPAHDGNPWSGFVADDGLVGEVRQ